MIRLNSTNHLHIPRESLPMTSPQFLIVDDDPFTTFMVRKVLHNLGAKTLVAHHESIVVELLQRFPVDCLVLDWSLCQIDAPILLRELDKYYEKNPYIEPISVIIYSVHKAGEMDLPKLNHIQVIDSWEKPMRQSQLAARFLRSMSW